MITVVRSPDNTRMTVRFYTGGHSKMLNEQVHAVASWCAQHGLQPGRIPDGTPITFDLPTHTITTRYFTPDHRDDPQRLPGHRATTVSVVPYPGAALPILPPQLAVVATGDLT